MRKPTKLNRDGLLPVDAKDRTAADWQDLYEAIERIKRNVAARHAELPPPERVMIPGGCIPGMSGD